MDAMWKEKDAASEDSSSEASNSPPDRKRKHKDKKRKKEKKHHRSHREKGTDGAEKKLVKASTATVTSAEETSPTADVLELETSVVNTGPKREEWMGDSETSFLFPSVLQQDLRRTNVNAKTAAREAQQRETERLYKARELNPFIHGPQPVADGSEGTLEVKPASDSVVGDGGASWLKRAYRRLEEQAEDRGCTVEEVAAERFGSLDQLKGLIAAAEKREGIVSEPARERKKEGREDGRQLYDYRRSSREGDRSYPRDGDRRNDSTSSARHTSTDQRNDRRSPETSRASNSARRGDDHRERFDSDSDRIRRRPSPDRTARDGSSFDKPRPAFVKPGENLPSSWKSRDKAQYVPKSNYTPAEKKAKMEAAEKKEETATTAATRENDLVAEQPVGLSAAELNQLNARILRAELMGDTAAVAKLKEKIASAGTATVLAAGPSKRPTESVVLSRTHAKGFSYPVKSAPEAPSSGKHPKTATHNAAGEREKYFADDDKYSLSQLVSMEKMQSAEDQNALFSRLAGKVVEKVDDDYGMDDAFIKKALNKESLDQMNSRDRDKAIMEHKQIGAALGSCHYCMEGPKFLKHLVIAVGRKALLMLPSCTPIAEGHCLICPIQHVSAATSLDEDVWEEMQTFRRALVQMFEKNEEDCVFVETAMDLKRHPHMTWECIPLDKETGSMAPMYFKKAILESEGEWAQNVKLVDLSKKDIRHAVPKNFPYFSVDFGMQGGYAHVIEDERRFPSYFGKEIVGGMIDAEPRLWLKNIPLNFNDQMKSVNKFNKLWEPVDFTQKK
ncbi:CWF19-like protein 2 [Hypsibius exemplaris]|uniref:CWF19-like protein 2 n=1 Tax=Hypsibius exemplaris TaxID=2072580 RepID=A0A1W0WN57_HYPEX|nr:CWF19-like protein 2 [Hypsibius exemplaris]